MQKEHNLPKQGVGYGIVTAEEKPARKKYIDAGMIRTCANEDNGLDVAP
jgi:hypothetical protein